MELFFSLVLTVVRCFCKRGTCELLHRVSFAFLDLAPQYSVHCHVTSFDAASLKDPSSLLLPFSHLSIILPL